MAICSACGSTIVFGGRELSGMHFCNEGCAGRDQIADAARQVPVQEAQALADQIHGGWCPQCAGPGPVDVRSTYEIRSAKATRWGTLTQVSCRRCGVRHQSLAALDSAVLGWWGFPWGLLITPVQIARNLIALARPHDPKRPSPQLVLHSRMLLAEHALRQDGRRQHA